MNSERDKANLMSDAKVEQARAAAADAAAARASQLSLSHSALQGTLAAQLVAKCDDDTPQQRKIARLVGGIGTKERKSSPLPRSRLGWWYVGCCVR